MLRGQRPVGIKLGFRCACLGGLGVSAAMLTSMGAHAQESQTADGGSIALEEIVVTARKRAEPLQEVPIAVTAFDATSLQNAHVDNIADLAFVAPDVYIARAQGSQNAAAVYIRGIGQDASTILNESAIGIYVDGVYLARQVGSLVDLIDISQVEVLRGPQGTLYGRNNIGGAIKIDTVRPSTDAFTYTGDITVGSFDRVDVRAAVNAPLNDQMAMTVSASSRTDSGYYTDVATGTELNRRDTQAARLGFLYQINSDLNLFWSADFSRDHSGDNVGTPFTSSNPADTQPVYGGNFTASPALPDTNRFSGWGTSATLEWDAGVGKLSSISAFRQINYVQADNLSGVPFTAPANFPFADLNLTHEMNQHQVSEEVQFTSGWSGPLSLTSGLYYFREYGDEDLGFVLGPTLTLPYSSIQTSTSEAVYTEGSYSFTDQWSLAVGGRFTHDSKDLARGGLYSGVTASTSENEFTPRAMLSYKPVTDFLLYGSWSRGYQEGEYQPFPGSVAQAEVITAPQKVTAYEVGAKTEWLEHRLRANLSVFRNTYSNLAVGVVNTGTSGSLVAETAADMRSEGAELELTGRVTETLTLSAYYARDKTQYLSVSGAYSADNPQVGQSAKDTPLNSGRFGADYRVPLDTRGHLEFGANYRYTSAYYAELPELPWYRQGGYGLLDGRIGYVNDKDNWSVELAGENLTNKLYFLTSTLLSGPMRFYMPQRTWSLQFKMHPFRESK
jgi:iron complex outermembrane receptor protein